MIDISKIKEEILQICNDFLQENGEPELIEDISVMNMSSKTVFLGNLKIFNEDNLNTIIDELNSSLGPLGKLTIKHQRITPCCSLPYEQVSFQLTFVED